MFNRNNDKYIKFTAIDDAIPDKMGVEAQIHGFSDAEVLEIMIQNLNIIAGQVARTHNCDSDDCNVQESATRLIAKLKEYELEQQNYYKR